MARVETLQDFSKTLYQLLKSDRDVNIAVAGFTGEGKSTFTYKLCKDYGLVSGVKWQPNFSTWSRNELLEWIDGKKGSKILKNGLKPKQLPEYSAINVDELWLLFYKRNWYDEKQIDSIATLNMCRDRHLLIIGNVPNFWDLDSAFLTRIRFYIYILERGKAWVFEQENNPFSNDPWNRNRNKILFRKLKNPFMLPNFVCEIQFPDFTPEEKIEYYEIRNRKRILAIDQSKGEKKEYYRDLKDQRNAVAKMLWQQNQGIVKGKKTKKLALRDFADAMGISREAARLILSA